jgi:hypothetical protein
MSRLYLDDMRPAPQGWTLVRWPSEVIERLKTGGIEEISLDHDLGDDKRGTGYDVLVWIEKAVATQGLVPPKIKIHTGNPVAKARMLAAVQAIKKRVEMNKGETPNEP